MLYNVHALGAGGDFTNGFIIHSTRRVGKAISD